MFEDIVICEITHDDSEEKECCNPHQIIIGESRTQGILITMLFRDEDKRKGLSPRYSVPGLEISAEVLDNDKTAYKDKYDIQTGVEFTITDQNEMYKMLIGSNGEHFHYFTNIPAINNTTDFGDTIFLSFPHTVEGFTYKDTNYKTFQ
jgi:hypothetical protein